MWISYQTVSRAQLCSCWLFVPCFSATDSLQECSQLYELWKGGAGCFCRIGSGKAPSQAPYFVSSLVGPKFGCLIRWILMWISYQSHQSPDVFLSVVCPMLFCNQWSTGVQSIVWIAKRWCWLLSQDRQWEGTFTCTLATLFLVWLVLNLVVSSTGYSCEYHTKQSVEPSSVPVSCLSHAFLQLIVCRSAVNCLNHQRVVLAAFTG
jgi:hypothetical protein